MRSLSKAVDASISSEASISHPLIETARDCRRALAMSRVNLRTGIKWFSRDKTQSFQKVKTQLDGDLVRAQSSFADRAHIPQHELMMMAAMLAAHHKQFKLRGLPLVVPCEGESITAQYYTQANEMLESKVEQLRRAYQHYLEKLQALQSKKQSKRQKKKIVSCVNKLKQVQQIFAGALFLQQQYQHMQSNEAGDWVITEQGLVLSANACRSIAKQHRAAGLDSYYCSKALQQAVIAGDVDQVTILIANPKVNINQCDQLGRSSLYLAAQHNRLAIVKRLMAHGAMYKQASDDEDSALTIALLNGHSDVVRYLLSCTPVESGKIKHDALHQGPVKKNLALRHVEYIFHCMLGVDFVSYPGEGDSYATKANEAGEPFGFRLGKNPNNFIIAYCPNGQAYNLSLALKHANLCYFQLTESEHDLRLVKQCEKLLSVNAEGKVADKLVTQIGDHLPIYAAEQESIRRYTGFDHDSFNKLLRGAEVYGNVGYFRKIFMRSMLAVSGTNKNIYSRDADKRSVLIRNEHILPDGMLMQMKIANQLVRRSGLLSFSENGIFGVKRKNKWRLQSDRQWQGSVVSVSSSPSEKEVLFPPSYVRFVDFQPDISTGKNIFTTQIVRGVATGYQENYIIELAVQIAFEILKRPYKDAKDARFGVARHNHALAHHIRVSMLIEPVIDYFKQFAADAGFKDFCTTLQPEEVIIMKVMMIFSKTGRESEASPVGSSLERYMEYQQASADHLRRFMHEVMRCDAATIEYYAEIMLHMGNPKYPELVTGDNDRQKQHKLYINYITALAHKLDLPRVYGESQYAASMSGYNGKSQIGTSAYFIEPSAKQAKGLVKLETLALSCLRATGDKVAFAMHGIARCGYAPDKFKQSNSCIDDCLDQCQIAYMRTMQQFSNEKLLLSEAVKHNNITESLRLISCMPVTQLFLCGEDGLSMVDEVLQSEHDCSRLIEAFELMYAGNLELSVHFLYACLRQQKHELAVKVIPHCRSADLDSKHNGRNALTLLLEVSGSVQVLEPLLDRYTCLSGDNNAVVKAACKHKRIDALKCILQHKNFDRSSLKHDNALTPSVLSGLLRERSSCAVIEVLVNDGAIITRASIAYAIVSYQYEIAELLIEKAITKELTGKNLNGETLIMTVILTHHIKSLFFSRGPSVEPRTSLLKALMRRGCDLYDSSAGTAHLLPSLLRDSQPPLLSACQYVINNAPIDYLNAVAYSYEVRSLMICVIDGHFDLVKLMLQRGVNVDIANSKGDTALLYAFCNDRVLIAEFLVERCSVSTFTKKNCFNNSPLSLAVNKPAMMGAAYNMLMRCSVTELEVAILEEVSQHISAARLQEIFQRIMSEVGSLSGITSEVQELIAYIEPKMHASDSESSVQRPGLFHLPTKQAGATVRLSNEGAKNDQSTPVQLAK
ncbi:MAG: SidE phosphodiesterase domain-containing protein [Coxiellaceae bacterium]|nr:SidE phosphodiesterase domain-containing protein [Coxiellaceae bacterium]